MTTYVEQPRHTCTLGGQQTVVAIDRAIPIVHGGPGCSSKLFGGQAFFNGFQGSGYAGGNAIVGTNTGENEVIFGGEDRLRGVIDGALKVMDGDLFVVLTGCTADLVGDDTGQVVSEYRREGVPIAFASTGGFKGNSYLGHEIVVEAIIGQLLEPSDTHVPNLVNLWSLVPYQDTFWAGNLRQLKELLEGIGLEVNVLFGHGSKGLADWRRIPSAAFNLVVSPWTGLRAARQLKEKFGTPFLHYPILPIGAVETTAFLRAVAEFAELDQAKVETYVAEQEDFFYHYLDRSADFFLEMRWDLPDRFVNVADAYYTLGITRFLVNELGLIPGPQFVIDDTPEEFRPFIEDTLRNLRPKVSAEVTFTHDGGEISRIIKETKFDSAPLIIGSSWERDLARQIGAYQLSIAMPITDRLVLDRGYVGYSGGLRLIEDIYASVLGSYQ
jgi:nitrogenase molybdenum-iron protein beta chain